MRDNGKETNGKRMFSDDSPKRNKKKRHVNNAPGHNVGNAAGKNIQKSQQGRKFISSFNERHHDPSYVRPKWIPAAQLNTPLPTPVCPHCGKPIRELAQALPDRRTGVYIHFDCAINNIKILERLEKNEMVTYLGGGRFGIISLTIPNMMRSFKIRKIIEWENKDQRAPWRAEIADHFSLT
ncbi:hypothetical protein FACS1894102_2930 [Spirochaetia bacterium]|nr:hypothetical protein FACS1894102_2930 [Spirochaetia bacterium]